MQVSGKTVKWCGNLAVILAAALAATASANAAEAGKSVFSDAAVWFRGAIDHDASEGLEATDLRHALDMSTTLPTTGTGRWGEATNCVVRYEDVPCSYAGTVMSNAPCFYMRQAYGEDGKVHPRHYLFKNVVAVTDCVGTVVARLRPDRAGVFTGSLGFKGGFRDNNGRLRLYSVANSIWQDTNFNVDPGTWVDVAIVSQRSSIDFYAVTNNGTLFKQTMYANGPQGVKTDLPFGLDVGGGSSWSPVDSGDRLNAFCGSIQQFAVWNRRLSESEVREALAFPRTDIMRIGIADGAGGEFVKSSPDGSSVNSSDWYKMPAALAPGESVDIAFWLKGYEHTLPQILRLTAASGTSANVNLDVSVNGVAVSEGLPAIADGTKTLFLPGELFVAGSNTLNLANNSSGTVFFDALVLGGSWQVGYDDASASEFAGSTQYGFVENGDWKAFAGNTFSTSRTNTLSVTIPAELAASGHPGIFSVSAFLVYAKSYYTCLDCELLVNGVSKGLIPMTQDIGYSGGHVSYNPQVFKVKVAPGELKPGVNEFSFVCRIDGDNGNKYCCIDYWRYETKKLPNGIVISFR